MISEPLNGHWPIEDNGLIGNRHAAALVNSVGSIDWLCWPRCVHGAGLAETRGWFTMMLTGGMATGALAVGTGCRMYR